MAIEIESPEELGYSTIKNNLSESSVSDLKLSDLGLDLQELLLSYPAHRGLPELRERIAAEGAGLKPENVLVTAGAAGALFLIAATLLKPGDRIVVAKPNYSTNLETPRALEAIVVELPLIFEQRYRVDLEEIDKRLTSGTKILSLTVPHNPTGTMMSLDELKNIIRLVESRGALLIFDETYREMAFSQPLPPLATLSDRVISVSSLSKAYGLPGIRIGWLLCRDPKMMELFLAAKEQVSICTSIVDEQLALRCLQKKAGDPRPRQESHVEKFLRFVLLDCQTELSGMGGTRGWRRLLPALPPKRGHQHRQILPRASWRIAHRRRPRPLVRRRPPPLPRRVWLPARRRVFAWIAVDRAGSRGGSDLVIRRRARPDNPQYVRQITHPKTVRY